jgi:hypothetical protein
MITDTVMREPASGFSAPVPWVGDRPDRVIFPPVDDALAAAPLRNVTCCALLRLRDDSARFLRMTAMPWTGDRLDAVERSLLRLDGDGASDPELARRIAYELGMPTLALANAPLDRVDPAAWDLRRTAVALVSRTLCRHPDRVEPSRAREQATALEQCLRADLERSLATFAAGLDPEARVVATRHGRLDVALYNFLVRKPHRAWRLQFAQTFPILVHAAATGGWGSSGANIRAMVDAGLPLLKHLAARWAVSPGTLRCLLGRAVDHIGLAWQEKPHTLVRILDALRPEDRPGDGPEGWRRLDDAVMAAEEIFRRPVASSPLTLGWLREAARHGFARLDETRGGRRLPPEAVPLIDRLRTALVEHLATVAVAKLANNDGDLRVAAATVADRQLAMLHPGRLAAIARDFALEYAPRRAALEREMRVADGRRFWPLLPRDFVAAAGARRVTPLATRAEFRQEGMAQDLCLQGGAELAHMAQACTSGEVYLLSVRDAGTGAPLSTAEIHVVRSLGVGRPELRVRQHKARGNARPSPACAAALAEALSWAAGREVQEHLEEGRRDAWKRRKATPATVADLDFAVTREALRAALGDDLRTMLERATQEVVGARGAAAAARPQAR